MRNQHHRWMAAVYRTLLLFYPAVHRRNYREPMLQLFRDQCRDAERDRTGPFALGRRLFVDLISSAIHEHLNNLLEHMRTISINKLSHLLLAVAICCAALTGATPAGPRLLTVFLYLSTAALLGRAIVEWFRPPAEWLKAIGWACVVFVAYGFIMPFWAKLHGMYGDAFPIIPGFVMMALGANFLVPVSKAIVAFTKRAER